MSAGISATVRPGCIVTLVNVSATGALVLGRRPLRPGGRVHLQVVAGSSRLAVAAHVLRCAVVSLHAEDGIFYGGALKFDHHVTWSWR